MRHVTLAGAVVTACLGNGGLYTVSAPNASAAASIVPSQYEIPNSSARSIPASKSRSRRPSRAIVAIARF